MFEALGAAILVVAASLVGVFFFGNSGRLEGVQRYVVPVAVGVFLSLVLYELIPETLAQSPKYGGLVVAAGFIAFYVLAQVLHKRYHHLEAEDCDRRGAAALLLVGDAIHNIADGVVLGGAFLLDPTIGFATALALALHEVPQEIVEFGVLIRGGYTRAQAALYNFGSASSIILGVILIMVLSEHASEYVWLLTGFAAGNLLFLAASDLLPRIHGNLKNYGSIWNAAIAIVIGFMVMTIVLDWTHAEVAHNHAFEDEELHDHAH